MVRSWFMPDRILSPMSWRILVLVQVVIFFLIWSASDFPFLPTPFEIGRAWLSLVRNNQLGFELATSLILSIEATALTLVVSLSLVYASVIPFFRPFTRLFSKFRFNGLVGLTLFFTVLTSNGHQLKLWLLVFSMSVWFVTSMVEVIRSIPQEEFEHARTLGMKEWRVVWEVVVLGTLESVFEVLRQNTAISWLMLTTVEGIVRTEGGIGAMLTVQSKYLHISEVLAIQITILVVGLALDWTYGFARRLFFPYADLAISRD
jgi:NitT/TauT family transport system permease protein